MSAMNEISLQMDIPDQSPEEVFAALRDFSAYPRLCPAVRGVQVQSQSEHEAISSWEVNFQAGILKWSERDQFDPVQRKISFDQLTGDIDQFSGVWRVAEAQAGSRIHFDARFDLGLPMLADMLDPVAKKAIEDNIRSIVHGLFLSKLGQAA